MNQNPVGFYSLLRRGAVRRGLVFGGILLVALLAFEVFNFSTTEFALQDVLGSELRFAGIRWATILALAFCGIDFAGIARLFTPQQGRDEPAEVWYLFGAWLLAAAFNALLTWWGVAVAIRTHTVVTGAVISQSTLQQTVPVVVALMVWLIRVLIIGTFSMAGDRLFSLAEDQRSSVLADALRARPALRPSSGQTPNRPHPERPAAVPFHPAPKPEPTYQPVGMSASPHDSDTRVRR
jgi:hypothetical protein